MLNWELKLEALMAKRDDEDAHKEQGRMFNPIY